MKSVVIILAVVLAALAVGGAATLWFIPIVRPPGHATLHLRVGNIQPHLKDSVDIRVYLKNGTAGPLYVTTNLDPFVAGQGMFRNYYVNVSGPENVTQSTRLFLDALQVSLDENQMLQVGVIRLLQAGETYSGRLPIETWADLVSTPGQYRISAGYRGTGGRTPLRFPLLEEHLESNAETVRVEE